MTKRTISCPQCQKKYQVPSELSGKKIKCPACQAVFVMDAGSDGANQKASDSPQKASGRRQSVPAGPSPRDYAKYGLEGPLKGEGELFPPSSPKKGQSSPLSNLVEDPGFAEIDPSRFVPKEEDATEDNPIYDNPALAHLSELSQAESRGQTRQKPKKRSKKEGRGRTYAKAVSAVVGAALGLSAITLVFGFTGFISADMFFVGLGTVLVGLQLAGVVFYILFLVRAFETAPAWEGIILILFTPYFFVFIFRYWSEVKVEALAVIAHAVVEILLVIGIVVAIFAFAVSQPEIQQQLESIRSAGGA